ncbi:Hypp2109 [Branchiostoma lanceolatum]|uniref:Hypp2109 protein n=1 Tax=Branchiostoma lanceolatum TaxID=7740 RepID=A0A8J9ZRP3_BRALA|nr:Hypp2109 [Branchiostoma lanceolatum]
MLQCISTGENAYLTSLHGWAYYKVRASGTMTSSNIKSTCEAAGLIMPCTQAPTCPPTSSICVNTGLGGCGAPMRDISDALCDYTYTHDARDCPEMEGIFTHYSHYSFQGESVGVQPITNPGSYLDGADYSDQFALCADAGLRNNNPCPPNWDYDDFGHYFICNGYGRADPDPYRCESFSCPFGWSCQDVGQLSFMCGAHV